MTIQISKSKLNTSKAAAKLIVYTSSKDLLKAIKFDADLSLYVKHLISTKQLDDTKDSIHSFTQIVSSKVSTYYFIFAHPTHPRKGLRYMFGQLSRLIKPKSFSELDIFFSSTVTSLQLTEAVEGLILGGYSYTIYKTDTPLVEKKAPTFNFCVTSSKEFNAALLRGIALADAQNISRNLANCPSNELTPSDFVAYAYHLFEDSCVDVSCFGKDDLENMNMGALLAVAQGSVNSPYLLKLNINASSKKKPIVLVGKGVTFDSGGISIKPSRAMGQMKADMTGAASVLACMKGLADLNETRPVIALIPLVENMPSATAYKPGDVVTAMNKKTIEIVNTDAEGRLILADALCYATQLNPEVIIDIATLTGACSVALGDVAHAICSNNSTLIDQFNAQEKITGEPAWQLPLYPEFLEYLSSDVADLIHCAENRLAGTSTAAIFLEQFVEDNAWLHIDIASTMHQSKSKGHFVKGMNGSGTRSLIEFVQHVTLT
jgi:leucyl aminopeptidase